MELLLDPARDPVSDYQIDVLIFVRFRHVLVCAAWPELDNDALTKTVFCNRECLLEHIRYVVLPMEESARITTGAIEYKVNTHNILVRLLYSS